MTVRIRSRNLVIDGGTAIAKAPYNWESPSFSQKVDVCGDEVDGTRDDHGLYISHTDNFLASLEGVTNSNPSAFYWNYNGFVIQANTGHVAASSPQPSNNEAQGIAQARTNPNKPIVDSLVFAFELRDIDIRNIPKRLKEFGKPLLTDKQFNVGRKHLSELPRSVANDYLAWQFGFLPFYTDLVRMLQFQKNVESKLKQLRNLQAGGASGGKITIWEDEATGPTEEGYATGLYFESNKISWNMKTTRKKWATCRWTLADGYDLPKDDAALYNRAVRLAYGLDISFATVWHALPWSWLVDWFGNIGDLVENTRNTISVVPLSTCVMLHESTRVENMVQTSGAGICSPSPNGGPLLEEKYRTPGGLSTLPEFGLPLLSGTQLSILGAIGATWK